MLRVLKGRVCSCFPALHMLSYCIQVTVTHHSDVGTLTLGTSARRCYDNMKTATAGSDPVM